ncbi:phage holin family protein [Cryobacterium arcticum]|uniref:phage holin family protein n=1 Tax=Cryobacterium arcticum TaxID=670052 RepID=UPI0015E83C82|nr:phage holin family protein [Cryobacterium arcticum]
MSNSGYNPKSKQSLFTLLSELPGQITALIKAEIDAFKADISGKAKNVGIGLGLFIGAAVFAYFAVLVFIAVAVIAIDLALPLWLSALIVAVGLLLVAVILALIGLNRVKKGTRHDPDGVTANLQKDVDAFKGVGDYDH